ncbi:MAG: hypothetical protein HY834_17245 [Devosia nanyangense]|uniref:Uncharacterized protein n=1 Tax=Devosia nanyangense TaxID=1228055 RepID=A0A933L5K6_9HYPH|nr:hypothetical protein [Devosia nanyangense]
MATFWITFRIANDAGYSDRYDALNAAIDRSCDGWWVEPTSFYLVNSSLDIDALATRLKAAINPRVDLVLVGMPDFKSARVVGKTDYLDSLRALMPFVKAA